MWRSLSGLNISEQCVENALLFQWLRGAPSQTLDKVLGDFAFALWGRKMQRPTCGRDVLGIRPFAFASLPAALYGSGIVPDVTDEAALLRRVARIYRYDDSLVAGIHRLLPAHTLEVSRMLMAAEYLNQHAAESAAPVVHR